MNDLDPVSLLPYSPTWSMEEDDAYERMDVDDQVRIESMRTGMHFLVWWIEEVITGKPRPRSWMWQIDPWCDYPGIQNSMSF